MGCTQSKSNEDSIKEKPAAAEVKSPPAERTQPKSSTETSDDAADALPSSSDQQPGDNDHAVSELRLEPFRTCFGAPLLPSNAERCNANQKLYQTGGGMPLLEPRFDSITKLMANIFKVPAAFVSFVGEDHAYIKSGGTADMKVPRTQGFCHWILVPLAAEVLVVPDCLKDGRFMGNPYVNGEMGNIAFWAGAPLLTSTGFRLGTLCIVDNVPRAFDAECCNILCNFAEVVVRETERYTNAVEDRKSQDAEATQTRKMVREMESCSEGVLLVNSRCSRWPLVYCNEGFSAATGLEVDMDSNSFFWDEFQLRDGDGNQLDVRLKVPAFTPLSSSAFPFLRAKFMVADHWLEYKGRIDQRSSFVMDVVRQTANGARSFSIRFQPAAVGVLDEGMLPINIRGIPVPAYDQSASHYYFGTVLRLSDSSPSANRTDVASSTPVGKLLSSTAEECSSNPAGAGTNYDSASPTCSTTPSSPMRGMGKSSDSSTPFGDVALGHLLGRGSFGNVYLGWWENQTVAVKVIKHKNVSSNCAEVIQDLEASLGLQLKHLNVVQTFKYVNKELKAHAPSRKCIPHLAAGTNTSHVSVTGPQSGGLGSGPSQFHFQGHTSVSNSLRSSRSGNLSDDASFSPSGHGGAGGEFMESKCLETWILLELCSLGSLQTAIDEGTFRSDMSIYCDKPEMPLILPTAMEVANALKYLHSKNVLHGDLTANNILLVEEVDDSVRPFRAKVSDFGLSSVHASDAAFSTDKFGTVTHMPPELLSRGLMSRAVDVYAMGVLLWELYVGERPWAGMKPVQIILMKTRGATKLKWPEGSPPQYKTLAQRCMHDNPLERPTFAEVSAALLQMIEAEASGTFPSSTDFPCYRQPAEIQNLEMRIDQLD